MGNNGGAAKFFLILVAVFRRALGCCRAEKSPVYGLSPDIANMFLGKFSVISVTDSEPQPPNKLKVTSLC